ATTWPPSTRRMSWPSTTPSSTNGRWATGGSGPCEWRSTPTEAASRSRSWTGGPSCGGP
ncbi:uncharacterized protein METZ01_LOCUS369717, partial [marine metagenome]